MDIEINYDKKGYINIDKELPVGIKDISLGRLYRIYYLSKNNIVSEEMIYKHLKFNVVEVYQRFIRELNKLNLIKQTYYNNEKKIIINPKYYISDNFELTIEIYKLFELKASELSYLENIVKSSEVWDYIKQDITDRQIYQKLDMKFNSGIYYTTFNEPIKESGIYLLFKDDKVIYIGKSNNMKNRINQHKKDKDFNSVKCIIFKDEGLVNLYEPYLIQKYKPIYNKDLTEQTNFNLPYVF